MEGRHKDFSRIRTAAAVLLLLTAGILGGCGGTGKAESNTTEPISLEAPEMPLELWKEEYLYEGIPAPENAGVYVLTESFSEGWRIYSFSFENFTLEEAREYIDVLESLKVKREHFDEYYENEIPILNYTGYVTDDLAVTLSQCGESGGMTVNVKTE